MEGELIIREVKPADELFLAKMIREVFEEHDAPRKGTVYSDPTTDKLYQLFQVSGAVLWVAEMDNIILGCCGIYPTEGLGEGCAELVKFYLPQKNRSKGIGRQLMEQCMRSAIAFGYKRIYLESLAHFSKAVGMYEKQGFKKLNQPMGNSGHTTCNIWMIKELE